MKRSTWPWVGAGALALAAALGGYHFGRGARVAELPTLLAGAKPADLRSVESAASAMPNAIAGLDRGTASAPLPQTRPVAHARLRAVVQATRMTDVEAVRFQAILRRHAEAILRERALVEETLGAMASAEDAPALVAAWEALADAQAESVSAIASLLGSRFAAFVAKEPAGPGPLALALYGGGEEVRP